MVVAVKVLAGNDLAKLTKVLENERKLAQFHPNIVALLGYCVNPAALVYEFMEGGSLSDVLESATRRTQLSLPRRVSLMWQMAVGLGYLHHVCNPAIRLWDVKPHNILLDLSLRHAEGG